MEGKKYLNTIREKGQTHTKVSWYLNTSMEIGRGKKREKDLLFPIFVFEKEKQINRTKVEPQRIVTTRLLYHVQPPVRYLSRLQRI
jgi:hypothetical protein